MVNLYSPGGGSPRPREPKSAGAPKGAAGGYREPETVGDLLELLLGEEPKIRLTEEALKELAEDHARRERLRDIMREATRNKSLLSRELMAD